MTLKESILKEARAEQIPEGQAGRWTITKEVCMSWTPSQKPSIHGRQRFIMVPPGTYTYLWCLTESTMHLPPGACVMLDTPAELDTHMEFMLQAFGDVLVTGLGLGCVVRGLLCNPKVNSVTVIERDADVLKLVGPHMDKELAVRIIHAEAEAWIKATNEKFDCAWHDVWTDDDEGQLPLKHANLMRGMVDRVRMQGAWAFPREFRRRFRNLLKMT